MEPIALSLFGTTVISIDGQPVPKLPTQKAQALLIYLAVEKNSEHRREELTTLLWPGMPERSARHNLRQIVYFLRQAFPEVPAKSNGKPAAPVPLLLTNRKSIQLHPEADIQVDVAQFEKLLKQTQEHAHFDIFSCPTCREDLESAVAIYQGDFLADFYLDDSDAYEAWSQMRRDRHRRQQLDALETLTTMHMRLQEYAPAQRYAERQLTIDNLRESAYRQLMEILALSGRRQEALAQYETCRRVLAEELGMGPSSRTTALYEQILDGDVHFDVPMAQGVRGYELQDEIGKGAYGAVHLALQPNVGRSVAVKVIRDKYANDPEFILRFEAEAQMVARLEHPNIVPLYDYWRDPTGAYLIMRYLQGGSLLTALESGPWELAPTMKLVDQVASALSLAHHQGVIHRDIKPANILLDGPGNAYLTDFGIAKDLGGEMQMTIDGALMGTPDYISPEQIRNEGVGPQSDIYSLGAVLYEMLAGEKPYPDSSIANLIYQHLNDPMPLVATSRPDLPAQIDAVIQRATAKEAAERYEDALEMAEALRLAISGAGAEAGALIPPPPGLEIVNPYKGLRAFQEADADDFFGRDALVQQLLARLDPAKSDRANKNGGTERFLTVVGPSGSGKSSVVKAGLLPVLREGAVSGSDKWYVSQMAPGTHPLEELERALWPIAVDPPASLLEPMQRDPRGILRTLRRVLPGGAEGQLLLLIDQFEELFTLVDDDERRAFFIESLLTALNAPDSPLRVIVTLRADFYDRPLQVKSLGQLVKQGTEIVLPMSAEELTWAVREPAHRSGVRLEEGLAEVIVADVGDQPGALPLMQYALTELFEQRQDGRMTLDAYREIGGVSGALSRRAEEIYNDLDQAGQEAARQLFLRLVTLGEGVQDTRRRVLRSELEALDSEQLAAVIDAFGVARLLTFDRDPLTREPTVEVAHEALLREWPRLRGWLDENRSDVRLQRMLATAVNEWQQAGQSAGYLLRGGRLDQFEGWAAETDLALTPDEQRILEASVQARRLRESEEEARMQRELQTAQQLAETERARAEEQEAAATGLRRRAYILGSVLVVALLLALTAFFFARQSNQNAAVAEANAALAVTREAQALAEADARATSEAVAEEARQTAEQQAQIAFSRELAAAAIANLDKDPERSVLLAMQGLNEAHTKEAEAALHRSLPQLRVLQTFVGHEDQVWTLDFNHDGSRLVTAGRDGSPRVWDAATGDELLILDGYDGEIWHLDYSQDGEFIAASGEDGSVKVWDAATGEIRHSLDGHRDSPNRFSPGEPIWVNSVDISPDSKIIATSGSDGYARLWNASTGVELETFTFPEEQILGIAALHFSPDGFALGMKGYGEHYSDAILRIVDLGTGSEVATLVADPVFGIGAYTFSPDGKRLLIGDDGANQKVILWDLETETEVTHHTVLENNNFDFSPDGSLFVTGQADGGARLWETETGREVLKINGHGDRVESVQFSPDGASLATASDDGTARIWDIGPGYEILTLRPFSDAGSTDVTEVAFSPDGTMLAAGGFAGGVSVWDPVTGDNLLTLPGHDDYVGGLFFSPDGTRLASAGDDAVAKVWDVVTGDLLLTLTGHEDWVNNLAFSPDGATIATIGNDSRAFIWDANSGQILHELPLKTEGWGITYSPDGALLVTGLWRSPIVIWDVETGQMVREIDNGTRSADDVHFTPDGSKLVAAGMDGSLTIWDPATGSLLEEIKAHQSAAWGSAVSPDGMQIASVSGDRTARVWDMQSAERLLTLEGHTGRLSDAEFSPDGAHLATTGDDTVRLWALSLKELVDVAESRVTRSLTEEECREYLHREACPVDE